VVLEGTNDRRTCSSEKSVQAAVDRSAVLVEEHLELDPGRLIDDIFDEWCRGRRHVRSIPSLSARAQPTHRSITGRDSSGPSSLSVHEVGEVVIQPHARHRQVTVASRHA